MPRKCSLFKDAKSEKFWVPEIIWKEIKADLPKLKRGIHNKGRPQIPNRVVLAAVLFVIFSGDDWRSIGHLRLGCSGAVAYRRFREWRKLGVFSKLAKLNVDHVDPSGINWIWLNEIENMLDTRMGDILYYDDELRPVKREKDVLSFLDSVSFDRLQDVMAELNQIPEFKTFYRSEINAWLLTKVQQVYRLGTITKLRQSDNFNNLS